MMWHEWSAMGAFGWAAMVLVSALLIFAVVWAVRSSASSREAPPDAVEVLRRRYALGEIEREEYEERRKALRRDIP